MIEMLVGLNITNEEGYANYRAGMTPLLEAAGGGFGYDFRVAETLKSETDEKINRVFTIYFPDSETMNKFFSNSEYLDIKKEHFEGAVASTTIMQTYKRKES
ncbi:MAG: DUF1330 domain-containing protein [Halobacteriovorax sp.]|nr:DUF1330 domain-containing protein [Halobacteriovorax sp.]|tara:strand:+ start:26974 stop:27279 length:306 start_codon:yes stop_codon:yes gene_type:complete